MVKPTCALVRCARSWFIRHGGSFTHNAVQLGVILMLLDAAWLGCCQGKLGIIQPADLPRRASRGSNVTPSPTSNG